MGKQLGFEETPRWFYEAQTYFHRNYSRQLCSALPTCPLLFLQPLLVAVFLNLHWITLVTLLWNTALKLTGQLASPSEYLVNDSWSAGLEKPSFLASSISLWNRSKPVSSGSQHGITPLVPSLPCVCPGCISLENHSYTNPHLGDLLLRHPT